MNERQCPKCNSMVDAAKAFCPDCGNSMVVEEQRQTQTEFNKFEGTEKLTRSGYELLKKEMGLDISESPPLKEVGVQSPTLKQAGVETPPLSVPANAPKSNAALWIIIGAAAFVFLTICVLVVISVFFYMR